jgi:hypothetical protein
VSGGRGFRAWGDALAQSPGYKWIVVGLLFFSGFLNLEDRVVIFSVMPLIIALISGGLLLAYLNFLGPDLARAASRREKPAG